MKDWLLKVGFLGTIYVVPIYISCTKEITLWESARAYTEYYIKEAGELGTKVLKIADSCFELSSGKQDCTTRLAEGNLHLKNNVTGIKGQNAPIVRKKNKPRTRFSIKM